jgi:hypothetical protein
MYNVKEKSPTAGPISTFQCIELTSDQPRFGLRKGEVGTVMEIYTNPPSLAYEVDFDGPGCCSIDAKNVKRWMPKETSNLLAPPKPKQPVSAANRSG